MIHLSTKIRTAFLIVLIPLISLASSCTKKKEVTIKTDILKYPTLTAWDFNTVINDSGKIKLIMSGKILEQYDNQDYPYTEFKYGIKVIIYNGEETPQGSVTSKYAKYSNTSNIWELKDSVVVINENNDKLETEVLNWNQTKDLIFTDRFVKITSIDQVIQGIGFESDSHLQHQRIKKVSATILIDEE